LTWLAGGSYLDITDVAGVSKPSFYQIVWKTIRAIVRCVPLKMVFQTKQHEINEAISHFVSISQEQAISNCAGVVDGFLLRTRVPSKNEVGNVKSYFSGHYQCY
jgi:hypothetical protein